jgi:hypothetical protein
MSRWVRFATLPYRDWPQPLALWETKSRIRTMRTRFAPFALLLAIACSTPSPTPDALGAGLTWAPVRPKSPILLDREQNDPNVLSPLPRGARVLVQSVPTPGPSDPAIVLSDGTRLPALNGVAKPPLVKTNRVTRPVVAVVVDERGMEWFEHADGCMTTSRYVWRSNRKLWDAVAMHAIPDQPEKQ